MYEKVAEGNKAVKKQIDAKGKDLTKRYKVPEIKPFIPSKKGKNDDKQAEKRSRPLTFNRHEAKVRREKKR